MTLEESLQRIMVLEQQLSSANQAIAFLLSRISELEQRLAKDSHNSHKPPSTDGLKKKNRRKSLRKKSGKKPGGQKGHPGHRLEPSSNPDKTIPLKATHCNHCGQDLDGVESTEGERRQTFDLPKMGFIVTEYCSHETSCPYCLKRSRGTFPEGVETLVQYGASVKAAIVYLQHGQFHSFERTRQSMEVLFGLPISEGTIQTTLNDVYDRLEPAEESIKKAIQAAEIVQSDETGMRVEETLQWIHSVSTETATLYGLHAKRGKEGMDAMGVLPEVQGRVIHDGWKSYFDYDHVLHGLCNAHHLRELIAVLESEQARWAKAMIDLLILIKKEKETLEAAGIPTFTRDRVASFELDYEKILCEGYEFYSTRPPPPTKVPKHRGRKKQWPGKNLLDRLKDYRASVLAFAYDFAVPFDNNLSERDLRMCKLRQKVSGEFRTEKGAKIFCRVRSVFSTARKRGMNIFQMLQKIFEGVPADECIQPTFYANLA